MNMPNELLQLQPDYLISWDFSDEDGLAISISRIEKDEKGTRAIATVLGFSHKKSGIVSLRQIIESFEYKKRVEEERAKERSDFLKKNFNIKPEG